MTTQSINQLQKEGPQKKKKKKKSHNICKKTTTVLWRVAGWTEWLSPRVVQKNL
jgi:hypothetical protein